MRTFWTGGFWLGPAMLGGLLILLGILLIAIPNLLQFVVAGLFIAGGISLLSMAWRMRQQVTYRRVDQQWQVFDDGPPGP